MKSAKTLLYAALFVFFWNLNASAQRPAKSLVNPWVGCYELRIAESDQWKQAASTLPRKFQLLQQPMTWNGFAARPLDQRSDWFASVRTAQAADEWIWIQDPSGQSCWRPVSED